MKRVLVVLAVVSAPLFTLPAQACSFDQCPGSKQVCELRVLECGTSARSTVCKNVTLPDPAC